MREGVEEVGVGEGEGEGEGVSAQAQRRRREENTDSLQSLMFFTVMFV